MASGLLLLQRALDDLTDRWADARRRQNEVAGLADPESAEERAMEQRHEQEAEAEYLHLSWELCETLKVLFAHARKRDPEGLRKILIDLLAPDIANIVETYLQERGRHGR